MALDIFKNIREHIVDANEKRYSAPDAYKVIPMKGWFILFDPGHFTYARVNTDGKAIIESVDSQNTAADITRKVAAIYKVDPEKIAPQIAAFLENMIETGFLHRGPYLPKEEPTFDVNQERPITIYVSPTFACNLNCIYCYNKADRKAATAPELTTEEWYAAFDSIRELGTKTVVFTGGEPLMRKDVLTIARYANSIGLSSQIMTNATLINEKNIDDIAGVFGGFALSLDSHIKETNDFLRGKGAFDKTIRTIRMLQERNKNFTIATVITKHNVWDLPGLHKFALEELNCPRVFPAPFIPNTLEEASLLPSVDDYNKAMEQVAEVAESFYSDDTRLLLDFHGVPVMHTHCGAAAAELSIDADGSVYPCQALHKPEFRGGNIKNKSLTDIYRHSPVLEEIRECSVDKVETCCDCEISNACGGGCRSLAYNLHGSIYSCNTFNCDYLKSIVYNGFWNGTSVPIEELKKLKAEKASTAGQ